MLALELKRGRERKKKQGKRLRMVSIYFFGDSICFGQYISPSYTWINRLSFNLSDVLMQNLSVNGDTTHTALNRMHYDILSHYPNIVYIQFGLNDCNTWETDNGVPRVTKECFRSNLYEMIERCNAFNVAKVILATNHKTFVSKKYNKRNTEYNKVIRTVANDMNTTLIEHEIGSSKKWLMEDGVHLNFIGHSYYYYNVKDVLRCLLEK